MLLSMTGHGEASSHSGALAIVAEVRTVNNRYFKLQLRITEGYAALEPQIEALVRQEIRRGTVSVHLEVDRPPRPEDYRLHLDVLAGYRQQLEAVVGGPLPRDAGQLLPLLMLPGVVQQPHVGIEEAEAHWPAIANVLQQALAQLHAMRVAEGQAMAADLAANAALVGQQLERIAERAPQVVAAFRTRLTERINSLLAELGQAVDPATLVREVALFAERSDISEEIVRLRSHLAQFDTIVQAHQSQGRKLEFLVQEMFREANTIAAKANDAQIAAHVIEIKAAIERMREMIQNVE